MAGNLRDAPIVYVFACGGEILTVGTSIWKSEDGGILNVRVPGVTSRVDVVCFHIGVNRIVMVDWSAIRGVALIDKLGGNSGGREVVLEYDVVARHHWVDVATL
jgi:hypothetical protein